MEALKNLSAEELMLRYQTSSPDEAYAAFSELYGRYNGRVYSFLLKKTKNAAETEDLMQKVFLKIHESKHLYKSKFKFEQWLFVIARSQALDFFRASSRYATRLKKFEADSSQSSLDVSLDAIDLDELNTLDVDQRELLEMKFIDELSYQEISQVLRKSEVSLRKSVSRLLLKLKEGAI